MKFQIPFYRNFKYFDKDKIEIFIKYKPDIKKLDAFIKEYSDYRIIIAFGETQIEQGSFILKDYKIIKALLEIHPDVDITVRIPIYNKIIEEDLNKYNIPHYYQYICCDWENLLGFCSLNVTDIRIGGNLAFMMKITSDFIRKKGIRVRCFCNNCEKKWDSIDTIKNFFIRPEDITYYAQFIDTFEFKDISENNAYNTLYKIYAIDQRWNDKLKDIIYNYDGEEINSTILPEFGEYRSKCNRRCLIEPTSCKICDQIIYFSQVLSQKNLRFEKNENF